MRNRRFLIGLSLVVVLPIAGALLPVGCKRGSESPAANLTPIRIGMSSLTPLHAAIGEVFKDTDILAKHGFEGEFLHFERGSDQHERCAAGDVDATFSCGVVAMVQLQSLPGLTITGSPGELGGIALLTLEGSSIEQTSDLAGKSVALLEGASAQLAMDTWLEEAGQPTGVTVTPQRGRGEVALADLLAGEVDAIVLWDPWLSKAVREHPLEIVEYTPFWSVVTVYEDHLPAEAWARYDAALAEALHWASYHPAETVEMASLRTGIDEATVREVLFKNAYVSRAVDVSLTIRGMHQQRLQACEKHALKTGAVPPGFSLAARTRPGLLGTTPP